MPDRQRGLQYPAVELGPHQSSGPTAARTDGPDRTATGISRPSPDYRRPKTRPSGPQTRCLPRTPRRGRASLVATTVCACSIAAAFLVVVGDSFTPLSAIAPLAFGVSIGTLVVSAGIARVPPRHRDARDGRGDRGPQRVDDRCEPRLLATDRTEPGVRRIARDRWFGGRWTDPSTRSRPSRSRSALRPVTAGASRRTADLNVSDRMSVSFQRSSSRSVERRLGLANRR